MSRPPVKAREEPDHKDKSTWLWGSEVAKQLRCMRNTVLNMVKNDLLHPYVDASGNNRYDPDEVFMLKYQKKSSEMGKPGAKWDKNKKRKAILVGIRAGKAPADLMIDYGASEEEVLRLIKVSRMSLEELETEQQQVKLEKLMEQQDAERKAQREARLQRLRDLVLGPKHREENAIVSKPRRKRRKVKP